MLYLTALPNNMPLKFITSSIIFKLPQKAVVKKWIEKVIVNEQQKAGTIIFVFTNDEELLKINQQFLKHNTYTDIITFDYTEEKVLNGEIYISIERVRENAEKLEIPFATELHRVIIHGILHLCGYKDKTKIDSGSMRKKEDKALRLLKEPN